MRIFFDTEFIEDGKTIDLLSIGLVRDDGAELYLENGQCLVNRASPWVRENVLPHMKFMSGDESALRTRSAIASEILDFAGRDPEFWAYYADYDWVVLCQLYGPMIDLPKGWPMWCRDLRQYADFLGVTTQKLKEACPQEGVEHHALADALWVRDATLWLDETDVVMGRTDT